MTKTYLFAYGTLLPHHAPPEIAPVIRRLKRMGRGSVWGRLYDLGEYPGAVLSKTGAAISGHIFELPEDPEFLKRLDDYEGFDPTHPDGSIFVRRKWPVTVKSGKRLLCWVYVYNRRAGSAPAIVGGDFSKMKNNRAR
jgi:gamma-glutamylcyclotransferase (GGCT)/AIG2-like uncharacterized protein YtfP